MDDKESQYGPEGSPSLRRYRVRARGEEIRRFILSNVEKETEIASAIASQFEITRQAANKHLKKLVAEGALLPEGRTRHRRYKLAALHEWRCCYRISKSTAEDQAWSHDIAPVFGNLPQNVIEHMAFLYY